MATSVKRRIVEEIHKPVRVNFQRRKYTIKGVEDLMQIDLSEFIPFSAENEGHKYVLFAINAFTKMAYGEPLKNKSANEVAAAMEKILKRCGPIKNVQSDDGLEFKNRVFARLMEKYNVNHYSVFSVVKASFVERFQRTFKGMLYKEFSMHGNRKWLPILQNIIGKYNDTKHSTIDMKPVQVTKRVEKKLLRTVYSYKLKNNQRTPAFKLGDTVRISNKRYAFHKGYLPHWSTEIFKIRRVQNTIPHTYLLEDLQGAPILGSFYPLQMQKTALVDDYLVEKIKKKEGDRLFVSWLGFSPQHDSWIRAADVLA